MRFMMSALKRSFERRFWAVYAFMIIPYLGCVLLYIFVDGDLYRHPGFTTWIAWNFPYLYLIVFFIIGIEHEIKARRAEKNSNKKIDTND